MTMAIRHRRVLVLVVLVTAGVAMTLLGSVVYRHPSTPHTAFDTTNTTNITTTNNTTTTNTLHENQKEQPSQSGRIVDGQDADPTRYPYFTFLTMFSTGGRFYCGGSLIWKDVVVTAAHCVQDVLDEDLIIYSIEASVNRTVRSSLRFSDEYRRIVEQPYNLHPEFAANGRFQNDVMVLKLRDPVTEVTPVALNRNEQLPPIASGVRAIGLGKTSETSNNLAENLQIGNVFVVDHDDCNDRNSLNGDVVEEQMLCAGIQGGGTDTCGGDSGAPLIIPGSNPDQDTVVGIVSFGSECGRPDKPGVYARVSNYYDFVWDTACEISDDPPTDERCGGSAADVPSGSPSALPSVRCNPETKRQRLRGRGWGRKRVKKTKSEADRQ